MYTLFFIIHVALYFQTWVLRVGTWIRISMYKCEVWELNGSGHLLCHLSIRPSLRSTIVRARRLWGHDLSRIMTFEDENRVLSSPPCFFGGFFKGSVKSLEAEVGVKGSFQATSVLQGEGLGVLYRLRQVSETRARKTSQLRC